MRLTVDTPNLTQRLSRFPTAPNVTLLHGRKPEPHPWPHDNTTFREQTYIRWCCIDLSNAPGYSLKWSAKTAHLGPRAFGRRRTVCWQITRDHLQLAVGQQRVQHFLSWKPAPRRIDPRQKEDDGSMRFTGDFLGRDVNKTPLDYQREREEAAARNQMEQHVNSISASAEAARREALELRGNTHSQTDQLQKMFVMKAGT